MITRLSGRDRFGISLNILGNQADVCGSATELAKEFQTELLEVELEKEARQTLMGVKSENERQKLLLLSEENKYVLQLHSPYRPREDSDIASADSGIRQRAIDVQLESLRVAADIGAIRMTLHPGCTTRIDDPKEVHIDLLCNSLDTLQAEATKSGIELCLENMAANKRVMLHLDPEQVCKVCDRTGVKYTLDMPHWATWYGLDLSKMLQVTLVILPYITNVHLADTVPPNHKHLPLGEGTAPIKEVVDFLIANGYEDNFIIEEPWTGYEAIQYIDAGKQFRASVFDN